MSEGEKKALIEQALRQMKVTVPEGAYYAWAETKIRIPRDHVYAIWKQAMEELLEEGVQGEEPSIAEMAVRCEEALQAATASIHGPSEYFSVEGYADFERRLFNQDYWQRFTARFPDIAPYLENIRKGVHGTIMLEYYPETIPNIEKYLAEAGYPNWTPNFFKRHKEKPAKSLHTWVRNHIQTFSGKMDWPRVVRLLSPEAREKFSMHPPGRRIPDAKLIPTVQETLDEIIADHGFWTPYLLASYWSTLYEKLRKKFRSPASRPDINRGEEADRPNWHEIITQLPESYRKKFRWAFGRAFKYRTERDAVQEFIDILTQWQPPTWGPRWLDENGFGAIRLYWENHFRRDDGRIDWRRLLDQLPSNLREGFEIDKLEEREPPRIKSKDT